METDTIALLERTYDDEGIDMENVGRIEAKIDTLVMNVSEIKSAVSRLEDRHLETEKWKVGVNMRLENGIDRMNHIDKRAADAKDHANHVANEVRREHDAAMNEMDRKITAAIKIEKRVLIAWLLGASAGGGITVAGAIKLLGL